MTTDKSSFERLCDAGVIAGEHFSESDKAVIAKITPDEVEVLIKLRKKMGEGPSGKEHMRPNIVV
jgi:hypothetical protein